MTRKLKNKICKIACDIFETLSVIGYLVWSTFYFYHAMCTGKDEQNLMAFIGCALTGWFMAPIAFLMKTAIWLSTIHINW